MKKIVVVLVCWFMFGSVCFSFPPFPDRVDPLYAGWNMISLPCEHLPSDYVVSAYEWDARKRCYVYVYVDDLIRYGSYNKGYWVFCTKDLL